MTLKPSLAAAALVFAPLVVAAQQAVDVTAYREAEDDDLVVQPFNLTIDQIEDMDLRSGGGEEIGEVDEVLIDAAGQPVAVTLEVGGFLGVGDREVVLGLDQLKLLDDQFVTDADKATIEALPDWED
jgi:PRC-barrel domain